MKNTIINRKATIKVAKALGELCDEAVFVGGAIGFAIEGSGQLSIKIDPSLRSG